MSKSESPNPYESPRFDPKPTTFDQIGDDVPFQGQWTMDYTGGFGMIHANPNWITNCFLAGLCGLIPIVGAIVLLGYSYETAELLHRSHGRRYWDFNFNRFGDYLSRGVGPFLVGLVFLSLYYAIHFGMHILMFIGIAVMHGGNQANSEPSGIEVAVFVLITLISIAISIGLGVISYTLQMRSGLANDIGQGFQISKGLDITFKIWPSMILSWLFLGLSWLVLSPIGVLTCCIGLIPLFGYFCLLSSWFNFQLYRLYLSRGGQPVQFKPLPTGAA